MKGRLLSEYLQNKTKEEKGKKKPDNAQITENENESDLRSNEHFLSSSENKCCEIFGPVWDFNS